MARSATSTSPREPQLWKVRPASTRAQKEWEAAKKSNPELMQAERVRLTERPLDRSANPKRTHKLKGELAIRVIAGQKFEQWQHELTGAGRIWYCPDKESRIIWVTRVSLRHPNETS